MLTPAIGKPAPPGSLIMLDEDLRVFAAGDLGETKPEEYTGAVFLVLVEIPDVDVAVGVDLDPVAVALVVRKVALVGSTVGINGHT